MQKQLDQLMKASGVPEPEVNDELRDLVRQGKKIEAVKLARQSFGFSLLEGKQYVDAMEKEEGLDPMMTVDYPEMGLKLKQGCGRLIRTKDDRGAIAIMESVIGAPWEKVVMGALPPGARITTIDELLLDR